MRGTDRLPLFALFVLLAVVLAVFAGPQVPGCLGPLGVTAVQCWAASGRTPELGLGVPLLSAALTGAALAATGLPRPPRAAAAMGAAGALVGAGIYLALRPTAMTGPTSYGAVISVGLPLDYAGVLAAGIAGAGLALAASAVLGRLRAAPAPAAGRAA